MATPDIAPTPDDSAERFAMIEIDPLPEAPEALVLPAWATAIIAKIIALVVTDADAAFAMLQALIAPARAYPNGPGKAAVRSAMESKLVQIREADARARRAAAQRDMVSAPAPELRASAPSPLPVAPPAPVPAPTERQAMPVVREPAAEPAEPAPRLATYARIKSGPHAGLWGVRVPSGRAFVRVGDIVLAVRNGERGGQRKRITSVVYGDNTYCICSCEDAPIGAPRRASEPSITAPAAPVAPVATVQEDIVPEFVEAPVAPSELETTLRGATGEITANTAERATVASQNAAPTSAGTVQDYTVNGRSIFDQPRVQRSMRVGNAAEGQTRADVKALIRERDFIAGAFAAGGPLQVSWVGGGTTTVEAVTIALATIGRENDAPSGPSAERAAGKAVESVRGASWDTKRLPATEVPSGCSARWQIGNAMSNARSKRAGDEYGRIALLVDLRDDGTLACEGDLSLAATVRSRFAAIVAKEVLHSDSMTAWLQGLLKRMHGAVQRGAHWYVPGGEAEAATALVQAVEPLWGKTHDYIPVTTGPALFRSLGKGLADEVRKVADAIETARETARKAARERVVKHHNRESERLQARGRAYQMPTAEALAAEQDLAAQRAEISADVAAARLADLAKVAARVSGYEIALGAEAIAAAKAQIAALRAQLEPLADDASLRSAMLELA